ncbi:MAG: hypothetical protein M1820_005639 [Bogoriella megaspora]|nr:MAG: hypothetical protein M1820_005639 [Bogoriella megaspora]
MLDRLPAEILGSIVQLINVKSDLTSLSLVSRLLNQYAIPELYRSITIRANDERDLTNFDLRILAHGAENLRYVKDLRFVAPFRDRLGARCIPTDNDSGNDTADEDVGNGDITSIYQDNLDQTQNYDESEHGPLSEETIQNAGYGHSVHTIRDEAEATATSDVEDDDILNETSDIDSSSEVTKGHILRHKRAERKHEMFVREMMSRLLPLFQNISENNLQSFSWILGTCMPPSITDYLSSKQSRISALTITSDISCFHLNRINFEIDCLDGLTQLRQISWLANSFAELYTLGRLLLQNTVHLQEIKIDCGLPYDDEDFSEINTNLFATNVLDIEAGTRPELFRALRKLTLFGVSLKNGVEDIIPAFRIPNLQFLKLQDCVGTNEMLDCLADSSGSMCLTSFELDFTGYFEDQFDMTPLMRFLRSFQGLEDLFVLFPPAWTLGREYWSSISNNHSSLRRIVHHESGVYCRGDGNESDGLFEILSGLETIRCLGVCSQPSSLSTLLARIEPRPRLKLLHIRPRGWTNSSVMDILTWRHEYEFSKCLPSVKDFANWAFNSNGLPDLQVLAYGDFSFGGRQPNILLCRSSNEVAMPSSDVVFRQLGKADEGLWELVQDNVDFLEACPEDSLLHVD